MNFDLQLFKASPGFKAISKIRPLPEPSFTRTLLCARCGITFRTQSFGEQTLCVNCEALVATLEDEMFERAVQFGLEQVVQDVLDRYNQ